MKEVRGGNKGPSPRLCPLALTAVGSIGTLEGQGVSNPGYLNTYRFQRSESENGELYNLLKQFWGLEATGITPQVERPLSPKEKLAFDKVNDSTGSTVNLMNSINWPASSVWVFIAQAGRALQR